MTKRHNGRCRCGQSSYHSADTNCGIPEELDVDVIEVAALGDDAAATFDKPWIVQYPDGRILQFDTEDEACDFQLRHRAAIESAGG